MQVDFDSLPDPTLTENARKVLAKRYLKKNEDGEPIETPKHMFWRVARVIADYDNGIGGRAEEFYKMMSQGYWVPNSPTLMNAGRPLGQLSACFVLPVEDCMSNGENGIYDTLKDMALIHQSGGGTGFSFSRLRPNGAMVKSTTGVASGPVSFMSLYDASTNVVKQGGTRRGANMGILRVDHPDILEFINCKQDVTKITNFNISVAVTDEFMEAANRGHDYDLVDPHTNTVVGQLNASEVLDQIIENAWATGEPGLFFIDEANKYNPVPHLGDIEATNPCGEQCLLPYDSCNLGSLNLGKFVRSDKSINWDLMRYYIHLSMRFLDNVIDKNNYPLPQIRDLSDRIRRVGNGVMGWADMLIKLGIPYDSDEALRMADKVADFFYRECLAASEILADERGVFPEWERSIWGPDETCARDENGDRIRPYRKLRNCNVNTVAPTGTISIIAGCSGGIEPLYAVAFTRQQAGETMLDVHPEVPEEFLTLGDADEINEKVAESELGEIFRTSADVSPAYHIRMQAVWQAHTDNSISKTINFPHEATPEDVRQGYRLAYDLDCKGVTVYRDGSRPGQVLSTGKTNKQEEEEVTIEENGRPQTLDGQTTKIESPIGTMYVTVNREGTQPYEVFINVGKGGSDAHADYEAIGRLLSTALRHGIPVEKLHKQLRGISSEHAVGFGENKILSGPDAVARVLQKYTNGDVSVVNDRGKSLTLCPECGVGLSYQEGCMMCSSCGYSKCG